MLIYGRNAVLEALAAGEAKRLLLALGLRPQDAKRLEAAARNAGVPVEFVPRIELDRALRTTAHQGVAAELPEVAFAAPETPIDLARKRGQRLLLVALDHIQDPRNFGAIIRSAEVFGAHGVVTEERRSAPLSAAAVKAAAGAASHIPVVQVTNLAAYLAELKKAGVWVYGADAEAAPPPEAIDWDRDLALVVGSEGKGLRPLIRKRCDGLVHIPTRGKVASLNASVAAAILLYEVSRSRGQEA